MDLRLADAGFVSLRYGEGRGLDSLPTCARSKDNGTISKIIVCHSAMQMLIMLSMKVQKHSSTPRNLIYQLSRQYLLMGLLIGPCCKRQDREPIVYPSLPSMYLTEVLVKGKSVHLATGKSVFKRAAPRAELIPLSQTHSVCLSTPILGLLSAFMRDIKLIAMRSIFAALDWPVGS